MRVPVSAVVGGRKIKIQYLSEIPMDKDDEAPSYGDTDQNTLLIRISTSKHKSEREVFKTLFHESLHAALAQSGVSNMLEDKLEETLITAMEHMVEDWFCLNSQGPFQWKEIPFEFEDE